MRATSGFVAGGILSDDARSARTGEQAAVAAAVSEKRRKMTNRLINKRMNRDQRMRGALFSESPEIRQPVTRTDG